jgi:dihydrofolate reductase
MEATVFCGTSVDGFIARRDGTLDFLPEDGGEPHGYDELMQRVDTIVFGRNTYETVLGFGLEKWPYPDHRVVVLSSRPVDLSLARGHRVDSDGGPPEEVVARLEATGTRHAYVDGGITVQRFLRAGLIDHLIVTRVPVLIGDGIPLFGSLPRDVRLKHVSTRSFPSGLVQSEYEIAR